MIERALGKLLRSQRGRDRYLAWHAPGLSQVPATLSLTSPAFEDGDAMPRRFAGMGVGDNLSPPLAWAGVPPDTAELVLLMQDPDAPLPRPILHLLARAIDPALGSLPEGALNAGTSAPLRLEAGSFGHRGYLGPRPIKGHGPHRYVFQLFALKQALEASQGPTCEMLLERLSVLAIAKGWLIGRYEQL